MARRICGHNKIKIQEEKPMLVGEMTLDELRTLVRQTIREVVEEQSAKVPHVQDQQPRPPLDLPIIDVALRQPQVAFGREEMYGDDGR
jgi:hypothetical protein